MAVFEEVEPVAEFLVDGAFPLNGMLRAPPHMPCDEAHTAGAVLKSGRDGRLERPQGAA